MLFVVRCSLRVACCLFLVARGFSFVDYLLLVVCCMVFGDWCLKGGVWSVVCGV